MAKSVNKVILLGNVGKDPEIRSTPGGTMVASFTLATSDRQKDAQGNWQDRTEWHNLKAFNRTAEIIRDYVKKGSKLYVEGKITTNSWDDKETGQKRYRTEILVTIFHCSPVATRAPQADIAVRRVRQPASTSGPRQEATTSPSRPRSPTTTSLSETPAIDASRRRTEKSRQSLLASSIANSSSGQHPSIRSDRLDLQRLCIAIWRAFECC